MIKVRETLWFSAAIFHLLGGWQRLDQFSLVCGMCEKKLVQSPENVNRHCLLMI